MSHYSVKNLHEVLLIIADRIHDVCVSNEIHYSLIGGTLLGAVRHKGFIPWDDDMDIAMQRKDYDHFLSVIGEGDDMFRLVTSDNTDAYGYGFAKLCLKDTLVEFDRPDGHKVREEVWIDIFPYDNIPDSNVLRIIHKSTNYFFIKLLEQRLDGIVETNPSRKKRIAFYLLGLLNRVVPISVEKRILNKNTKKYNNKSTREICSLAGSYGYEKELKPADFFDGFISVPFEDREYMIIQKYELYLRAAYGDNYMELPPVEKRITHNYKIINLR